MLLEPRTVKLTTRTGIDIQRTLPNARKRTIGAWCFVDHFGPTPQEDAMVVAAHPHTGLQTATWLLEGLVEHRDSLGTIQTIAPGQLNLMTAGRGISHSELSVAAGSNLHAVQLWIALPEASRHMAPAFQQVSNVPQFWFEELQVQLFVGAWLEHESSAKVFSDLIGAELRLPAGGKANLPIEIHREHGLLILTGEALIAGQLVSAGNMEYQPAGDAGLTIENTGESDLVAILLGGRPFDEEIVMWWNFIERSHEEIVAAREEWNQRGSRFGNVDDRIGGWTPAPELPNLILRPRKD